MTPLTDWLKKWFETSSPRQKLVAALLGFSLLATAALVGLTGGSNAPASDPLASPGLYFAGVIIKLIGVLLLIVASAALLRRWMQPGSPGKTTRQLHLLETVRLSPRQALHLVAIGDQRLLIGATDQSIALLAPVEGNFEPLASETQPGLDFSTLIRSFSTQPLTVPEQQQDQVTHE